MFDRIRQVRWLKVPFIERPHLTDDEHMASVACCPCYVVGGGVCLLLGGSLALIAVAAAGPPFMIIYACAGSLQMCFGRDLSKPWWEREAWVDPGYGERKLRRDPGNTHDRVAPATSSPDTLELNIEGVD